jgi:hypothetical protein
MSLGSRVIATGVRLVLVGLVIQLAACKSSKPSIKTFASPEEAGAALQAAAKSSDESALESILGPGSQGIISSGDQVEDKNTRAAFVDAYQVMHRWRRMGDGYEMLLVGYTSYPFPVPLKQDQNGKWSFDTAAGREEVLNRRIGRNELSTIAACNAVVDAQMQYFSQAHDGAPRKQYAQKFISDLGKHNGLYWDPQPGQLQSPLGPLAAFASAEGYSVKPDAHIPFHGYYFHMLKGQTAQAPGGAREYVSNGKMTGGFAFVAYPAQYGNSGVMTFIINQDGVLLQKDLGANTNTVATAMTQFDPDSSWTIVGQ